MEYDQLLSGHLKLATRKDLANKNLAKIQSAFLKSEIFRKKLISVFAAGSFGRKDIGSNSDLDLFVVAEYADKDRSRLDDLEVLAEIIEINRDLKYPPISNDGEFLKVYSIEEMKRTLGDRKDDSENLFTARMLMLLESTPICNENLYDKHMSAIAEHYFRDYADHKPFKPLFLVNDILRYWRTLCLNYEGIRNNTERPWRKRNINLKFSRMLTVFGSVLPIIANPVQSAEQFVSITRLTPLERFATGLQNLKNNDLNDGFNQFLNDYETFLQWKENENVEKEMKDEAIKKESRLVANRFSYYIYKALTHPSIPAEYQRYLII